jgi:hypothetical protein
LGWNREKHTSDWAGSTGPARSPLAAAASWAAGGDEYSQREVGDLLIGIQVSITHINHHQLAAKLSDSNQNTPMNGCRASLFDNYQVSTLFTPSETWSAQFAVICAVIDASVPRAVAGPSTHVVRRHEANPAMGVCRGCWLG